LNTGRQDGFLRGLSPYRLLPPLEPPRQTEKKILERLRGDLPSYFGGYTPREATMSYSTVYGLWPGEEKRVRLAEFRNSWGMAPVVWDALSRRHLGTQPHAWSAASVELWKLHERADVPLSARAVLRMTFDHCYIEAEDIPLAINDIALFLHAYADVIPTGANHWPVYASTLVTFKDAAPAFGVHQTSVSANTWEGPYDEATDSRLPFDWSHASSVYDGLQRRDEASGAAIGRADGILEAVEGVERAMASFPGEASPVVPSGAPPTPPHVREDYREVWLSGWRAGFEHGQTGRLPSWAQPLPAPPSSGATTTDRKD
jgi:hypothetical protein